MRGVMVETKPCQTRGNRGAPREEVPLRTTANMMRRRANGANSSRSIYHAESQWGLRG